MHRTVLHGFPDNAAGGPGRVLWRLERENPGRPRTLLVQSEKKPDWEPLLTELPPYYLMEETLDGLANPDTKQRDPAFALRQQFVFRLRANPTVKRDGKRHGLFREEDQAGWPAKANRAASRSGPHESRPKAPSAPSSVRLHRSRSSPSSTKVSWK